MYRVVLPLKSQKGEKSKLIEHIWEETVQSKFKDSCTNDSGWKWLATVAPNVTITLADSDLRPARHRQRSAKITNLAQESHPNISWEWYSFEVIIFRFSPPGFFPWYLFENNTRLDQAYRLGHKGFCRQSAVRWHTAFQHQHTGEIQWRV